MQPMDAPASRLDAMKAGWVTFFETLKLALDALRAHKLRSFLTLLGVILAVTTLIFVMSVIAGLNLYVGRPVLLEPGAKPRALRDQPS